MSDAVTKIVDLQTEIDHDIHQLVDVKRQIVTAIKAVDNKEYQTLLELRFLCGCTWEEVSAKMGQSPVQHTYRMRDWALAKVVVPKLESK